MTSAVFPFPIPLSQWQHHLCQTAHLCLVHLLNKPSPGAWPSLCPAQTKNSRNKATMCPSLVQQIGGDLGGPEKAQRQTEDR
jgi:hypothetical protein